MNHHAHPARRMLLAGLLALALGAPAALADVDGTVNVNTATQAELEMLPGIGPAKARAILETRRERDGFDDVDELLEVKGIGDRALERIRPQVSTQGRTTLQAD